jgi:predicted nucleic acid-binding protein
LSPLDEHEVSFDANVVADFELTGNTHILEQVLKGRMLISDFVQDELRRANINFSPARVIALTTEEQLELLEELRQGHPGLGLGELGAITVARVRTAVLASNDGQARKAAIEVGVQVSGSLGILEHGVSTGHIEPRKAVQVAEEIIAAGAWISEDLVDMFKIRVMSQ